jgi:NAD(P)-dependent dehydrogenase (short-subunit alcohol dehydrogenase family)
VPYWFTGRRILKVVPSPTVLSAVMVPLCDISHAWDMEKFKERAKAFALGRGGEPEEVVGAALYFASEASSFCTGAILRLDGGTP